MDPSPRGKESTALEQAVSRAVRDNLPLVQHTTKELGQAIEDFVAACGSTRNANMLPAMLRAQAAAASLTSMLDVLARLLTASLQPGRAGASEAFVAGMAAVEAPVAEPAAAPVPSPRVAAPTHVAPEPVAPPVAPPPPPPPPVAHLPEPEPEPVAAAPPPAVEPPPPPPVVEEPVVEAARGPLVPAEPAPEPAPVAEFAPSAGAGGPLVPPEPAIGAPPASAPEPAVAVAAPPAAVFRVEDLPAEQQELHRRANRHAKVSMQDIYLLRPKDVKLARENKDICIRLRGDIEKARKEYVRRFGPILEHPVDYFYHWMVEVLAEGKPETLGEYPYPSAATRR